MTNWLPIDTAPKDGTYILLFEGPDPDDMDVGFSDDGATWWDQGIDRQLKPSHWMPLPAPPKTP